MRYDLIPNCLLMEIPDATQLHGPVRYTAAVFNIIVIHFNFFTTEFNELFILVIYKGICGSGSVF